MGRNLRSRLSRVLAVGVSIGLLGLGGAIGWMRYDRTQWTPLSDGTRIRLLGTSLGRQHSMNVEWRNWRRFYSWNRTLSKYLGPQMNEVRMETSNDSLVFWLRRDFEGAPERNLSLQAVAVDENGQVQQTVVRGGIGQLSLSGYALPVVVPLSPSLGKLINLNLYLPQNSSNGTMRLVSAFQAKIPSDYRIDRPTTATAAGSEAELGDVKLNLVNLQPNVLLPVLPVPSEGPPRWAQRSEIVLQFSGDSPYSRADRWEVLSLRYHTPWGGVEDEAMLSQRAAGKQLILQGRQSLTPEPWTIELELINRQEQEQAAVIDTGLVPMDPPPGFSDHLLSEELEAMPRHEFMTQMDLLGKPVQVQVWGSNRPNRTDRMMNFRHGDLPYLDVMQVTREGGTTVPFEVSRNRAYTSLALPEVAGSKVKLTLRKAVLHTVKLTAVPEAAELPKVADARVAAD